MSHSTQLDSPTLPAHSYIFKYINTPAPSPILPTPLLNLKLDGGIFNTCHTRESKNKSDKVWNKYPYITTKLLMQGQTFWPKPIATSNAIIKSYNNNKSSTKAQPLVGLEFQCTLDPCLTLHPQIISLYPHEPLSVPLCSYSPPCTPRNFPK
jgi:hypothetical protein